MIYFIYKYINNQESTKKTKNNDIKCTVSVPNKYMCFQCKTIGKHWIMQCPHNK